MPPDQDQRREQGATQAIKQAGVQEWPPDEGIGAADELGDLDLRAALLDLEADGVADHRQHAQAEHATTTHNERLSTSSSECSRRTQSRSSCTISTSGKAAK